ncbi:MAG: hypothetical protein ACOY4L_00670 [Pseudomonadota bacterium]
MIELFAMIAGPAIGVLLWSFLNASILQWRARKLRNLSIRYKDAYLVSIKAGLVALVVGDLAVLAVAFSGNSNEQLLNSVGLLFGVTSWWFAHSNGLLKLAGQSSLPSPKDARAISASVFGYWIGGLFALSLVLLLGIGLVSLIK